MVSHSDQRNDHANRSADTAQYAETLSVLEGQCAQCIDVAQQVRSQLQSGKSVADLTPLLRQSAAQVTRLQQGIHALAQHPPQEAREEIRQLAEQMGALLALEEDNHQFLASKGLPINRPRPYQYGAGAHPRAKRKVVMTPADSTSPLHLGRSDNQLDNFTDSYVLFQETTRKYREAYEQLEAQFESLTVKLEETNVDLQKRVEERDRVTNYLNNILDSMSGGVLVVDLNSQITHFNQEAEELTGYEQDQVLGYPYADIIGLADGRQNTAMHTLDTGERLLNREKSLRRADGRIIPLGFSTSLLRDEQGTVLGVVEVFNDLTEVKRLRGRSAAGQYAGRFRRDGRYSSPRDTQPARRHRRLCRHVRARPVERRSQPPARPPHYRRRGTAQPHSL